MTKHEGILKNCRLRRGIPSSLRGEAAFTILELLVVITIIIILAGLTIATMGYVQDKAKRSRAEAEIAAISAALENYKADNGIYPRSSETDALDPTAAGNPTPSASLKLYEFLSGDTNHDRKADTKSYFSFKPNQLSPTDQTKNVTALTDPFGNPYGYSTLHQADVDAAKPTPRGYNPTFDLWSTAGGKLSPSWIKNW